MRFFCFFLHMSNFCSTFALDYVEYQRLVSGEPETPRVLRTKTQRTEYLIHPYFWGFLPVPLLIWDFFCNFAAFLQKNAVCTRVVIRYAI